jgi:hypothetical protein
MIDRAKPDDRICTWCGDICDELVKPHREDTAKKLLALTGLTPPEAERRRVLRCAGCGHLEWFVVEGPATPSREARG